MFLSGHGFHSRWPLCVVLGMGLGLGVCSGSQWVGEAQRQYTSISVEVKCSDVLLLMRISCSRILRGMV